MRSSALGQAIRVPTELRCYCIGIMSILRRPTRTELVQVDESLVRTYCIDLSTFEKGVLSTESKGFREIEIGSVDA